MRNLVLSVTALGALAVCACGGQSKEAATAKTARYQGDKLAMFADTRAVVEASYKIAKSDETELIMHTQARWYTPEGLAANFDGNDVSLLRDKSIQHALTIQLLPEGDKTIVKVTPVISRYNRGMPAPEPLSENHADLPGWVEDKTNTMAIEIHKALAPKYEVKGVPQMVPAGNESPPPAPAPAEGSAAAPAEGSAAPATP
jgi:hypothetical protein